jgi:GxxExxY protein
MAVELIQKEISQSVIGAFFDVHSVLGFGFLESIYASALELELRARGHTVGREVPVEIFYKKSRVGIHRMDMIIDDVLILEIKSTAILPPTARRQLLNYLRGARFNVGLVLHFGPKPAVYREICTW